MDEWHGRLEAAEGCASGPDRSGSRNAPYPPAVAAQRASRDIRLTLLGEEMQIVEIELDPGETVIAEAGSMNYMDQGVKF